MFGFIEWADSRIAKMRCFDIVAIKLAVLLFTLFLVKIWPPLIALNWRIYLILAIIVAMPPIVRSFERGMIAFYSIVYLAIYLAVEFLTTL